MNTSAVRAICWKIDRCPALRPEALLGPFRSMQLEPGSCQRTRVARGMPMGRSIDREALIRL
jgi:hypothetical protein